MPSKRVRFAVQLKESTPSAAVKGMPARAGVLAFAASPAVAVGSLPGLASVGSGIAAAAVAAAAAAAVAVALSAVHRPRNSAVAFGWKCAPGGSGRVHDSYRRHCAYDGSVCSTPADARTRQPTSAGPEPSQLSAQTTQVEDSRTWLLSRR